MTREEYSDYVARRKDGGAFISERTIFEEPFEGFPTGGAQFSGRECAICGGPRNKESHICATCFNALLLGYLEPRNPTEEIPDGKAFVKWMVSDYRRQTYADRSNREVPTADFGKSTRQQYQDLATKPRSGGPEKSADDEVVSDTHIIDTTVLRNAPALYDQRHRFAPCGRRFNLKKKWSWRDASGLYFLRPDRTKQYKKLCGKPRYHKYTGAFNIIGYRYKRKQPVITLDPIPIPKSR